MEKKQRDEAIMKEAERVTERAVAKEPLLSGQSRRVLLPAAYYIVASQMGRSITLFEVADMFNVSLPSLSLGYRRMARAVGTKRISHERDSGNRTTYDIYAEILSREGESITMLIKKIHGSSKKMIQYLESLKQLGLVEEQRDKRMRLYFPTEKGRLYLEYYRGLRRLLEPRME